VKEGSTEAPVRHPLDWQNPEFYDFDKIEAEMERVFDICHGCRRCFNLCDSFPKLFDLVDNGPTGEMDGVKKDDYKQVADACTLCDLCFMTKCPYVPPHEFNLDFPHLILRYRAAEAKAKGVPFVPGQLTQMDRNGTLAQPVAGLVNWGSKKGNGLTRPLLEKAAGIDAKADLPAFASKSFTAKAKDEPVIVNRSAPAFGRKAVIYATCFVNYNQVSTGDAARRVLAKNGVEAEVVYPACCGMPHLEQGQIGKVAGQAEKIAAIMVQWIDKGYDVITLTASCGLMFKFEWPLILPDNADVKKLAASTYDIDQYVVDIAKKEGLAEGLQPVDGGVTVHHACHARAQNMGNKAAEMLRLIPGAKVGVIERCSGHGGTFGVMKPTHDVAMKVGKPVAQAAIKNGHDYIVSDCPLAAKHIRQGMEAAGASKIPDRTHHPIEIMAKAYRLD